MRGADGPAEVAGALAMLDQALDIVNGADIASLPGAAQADALRALERCESKQTAARAHVLAAFAGQSMYEADGQRSARSWLAWHTRVTAGAAAGAVAWARRAAAHPVVVEALASGNLSGSWGREICRWTEALPQDWRWDADTILVQAAVSGARLEDLAALGREMWERARAGEPDQQQADSQGEPGAGRGLCAGGSPEDGGDLSDGENLDAGGGPGDEAEPGGSGEDGQDGPSADGASRGVGPDGDPAGGAPAAGDPAHGFDGGACGPAADDAEQFEDRWFDLGITFGGAGRAEGDLTPGCAAALRAVLEALSKKAGPEDERTAGQRRHDALAEACRRLLAAGLLPERAGQPTQAVVHMTLAQLRAIPGAQEVEAAWVAVAAHEPGWLTGFEADAAACDCSVVPTVSGHVDWAALDRLADAFLTAYGFGGVSHSALGAGAEGAGGADCPAGPAELSSGTGLGGTGLDGFGGTELDGTALGGLGGARLSRTALGGAAFGGTRPDNLGGVPGGVLGAGGFLGGGLGAGPGGVPGGIRSRDPGESAAGPSPRAREELRRALLAFAIDALSGPGGLASALRAHLAGSGPLASVSLPLDIGPAGDTIPAHLRRAAMLRHPTCAWPGCSVPATACEIHHIIPRSRGGPTSLRNLAPACKFHHLVAIHAWGWRLRLNADGTTTVTSPDRSRVYHSHPPPGRAA